MGMPPYINTHRTATQFHIQTGNLNRFDSRFCRFGDHARSQASRTNPYAYNLTIRGHVTNRLQVRKPSAASPVVCVANIIPRHGTFSAKIAPSAHIFPSPSRLRKINKNQQTGVSFYHTSRLKANENTVAYITSHCNTGSQQARLYEHYICCHQFLKYASKLQTGVTWARGLGFI